MKTQTRGSLLLLLCAAIWGAAFTAQSAGMAYVGPFTMGTARFFLAGIVLLPVIAVLDRSGLSAKRPTNRSSRRAQLRAGLICGVLLFAASSLQQLGLLTTSAGKSGFITALYLIFVPIIGLFTGRKPSGVLLVCVPLALAGLYLLCVKGRLSLVPGDWLTLGCAVIFTVHICYISAVSPHVDCVRLSCQQFFVCAALCAAVMVITETPSWAALAQCWLPIVYAGVCSGGIGYTLQIIGERDVPPAIASLLMSLESVFAALFAWILAGERLSTQELAGCALMFTAILLSQLPPRAGVSTS